MCGISGILYFEADRHVDPQTIAAMNQAMVHRGPDDGGLYIDGALGFGHRRLSIIDLSAGHQPMTNEDETIWITFNGEIYNYTEIREELIAKGHRFATRSDTEVIVHLYEEVGAQCVHRLQGMFAFAVWDKRLRRLFLARDRLGIKPLYYYEGPEFIAFSSEIKPLVAIPGVPTRVDIESLHHYLTFRYNIAPRTMFTGISKLLPGHVLVCESGRTRLEQYWDLDYSRKLAAAEPDLIEEFRERFMSCARSHLIGDVPIGVLLSGGMDSTAVTAAVSELRGSGVKTFSVAFADDGDDYDERRYARVAARHFETDHYEIALTHQDFVDGLIDYVWHTDEPMADPASIPLYYVSQLARKHVTVILSGEGSDELFGGYSAPGDFRGFDRAGAFRQIPAWVREGLIRRVNDDVVRSTRLDRYLALAKLPASHYPLVVPSYMSGGFSEPGKRDIYGPLMNGTRRFRASSETVVDMYRKTLGFEYLDQLLYVYTKQWLPDDLLLKADKMTMAHSLELRVPFLDHTLTEFVAALPPNLKLRRIDRRRCITKYILKKAFEHTIPPEIAHRRKLGFPVPMKRLFQHELKEIAWDVFGSKRLAESGLFAPERLRRLLIENENGTDHSSKLWAVLVFGIWCERFHVTTP